MIAGRILNVAALAVAVVGGIFLGLFSCGGYAWHKPAFLALLVACTGAALFFPASAARPLAARIGLVVLVGIGYLASQAAAAAFYPAAPASWSEFATRFASSLVHGPC